MGGGTRCSNSSSRRQHWLLRPYCVLIGTIWLWNRTNTFCILHILNININHGKGVYCMMVIVYMMPSRQNEDIAMKDLRWAFQRNLTSQGYAKWQRFSHGLYRLWRLRQNLNPVCKLESISANGILLSERWFNNHQKGEYRLCKNDKDSLTGSIVYGDWQSLNPVFKLESTS